MPNIPEEINFDDNDSLSQDIYNGTRKSRNKIYKNEKFNISTASELLDFYENVKKNFGSYSIYDGGGKTLQ